MTNSLQDANRIKRRNILAALAALAIMVLAAVGLGWVTIPNQQFQSVIILIAAICTVGWSLGTYILTFEKNPNVLRFLVG